MRDLDTRIADRTRSVGDVPAASPVVADDIESAVLACVEQRHHDTASASAISSESGTPTTVRMLDANATAHECAGASEHDLAHLLDLIDVDTIAEAVEVSRAELVFLAAGSVNVMRALRESEAARKVGLDGKNHERRACLALALALLLGEP